MWNKTARIALFGCALIILYGTLQPALGQEKPAGFENETAKFRDFFRSGIAEAEIVGGSVAIVGKNGIIYEDHAGYANLEEKTPITRDTIYNWASISKAITAIAAMQLHERGLLSIDDPVAKYLPEFRLVHDEYGSIDDVTIRHMLTHTSGYVSPAWPWRDKEKEWQSFSPTQWEQFAARLPYAEIVFKPGSSIRYSNAGHMFVARIIEKVTGEKFEMYVDKNIFSPLEMHSSFFNKSPYYLLPNRSHSYSTKDGEQSESWFDFDTGIQAANGGWNGSVDDMVKFLGFIIGATGDPAMKSRYETVLSRGMLESMWKPHYKFKRGGYPFSEFGREESNALGITFFLEENFGIKAVSHAGGQEDFSTWFYYDIERDIAYVTAFNSIKYEKTEDGGYVPKATFFLELGTRDYIFEHIFPLFEKVRTVESLTKGDDYYGSSIEP